MSKPRTIFEIYRENDENFARPPSAQAWEKLERKLDTRPKSGKIISLRYFAVAASVAVLLGLAAVAGWWIFYSQKNQQLAVNGGGIEFLEIADDADYANERRVLNEYRAKFANFIAVEEASDESRTIESPFLNTSPRAEEELPAAITETATAEPQKEIAAAESAKPVFSDEMAESTTSSVQPAPSGAEPRVLPSAPAGKMDESYAKLKSSVLQSFAWLVGTWEEATPFGKSVEKWRMDSPAKMSGMGWLIQGDDTIFTEKLALRSYGDKVFFYQNSVANARPDSFLLSENSDGQWVFENDKIVAPNQVVLSQLSRTKFSTEVRSRADLQNNRSSNFYPSQQQYLNSRNAVLPDRAVRNMKKVN